MLSRFKWLFWAIAIVLIGNFAVLMVYGDTLRSTHLFIVRGTVFYPVSMLNLAMGLVLIFLLVREMIKKR